MFKTNYIRHYTAFTPQLLYNTTVTVTEFDFFV